MKDQNKTKVEKPVALPVGKGNKPLNSLYEKTGTIPFHSVALNIDYAQLQALGKAGLKTVN